MMIVGRDHSFLKGDIGVREVSSSKSAVEVSCLSVIFCETWSYIFPLSPAKSQFIHPASYPCFQGWVRSRRVEPHVALLSLIAPLGRLRSSSRWARVGLCWRLIFEPTLKFACHFGCGVKDPVEYLCILDMSLYKSQTRMIYCWLQRRICCGNESMFFQSLAMKYLTL